jgi:uncharacterized membrane protein
MPLCARCTAMHLGLAATLCARAFAGLGPRGRAWRRLALASAVLLAPMALDVALIEAGLRRGDLPVRLATGLLAGGGLALGMAAAARLAADAGELASEPRWRSIAAALAALPPLAAALAVLPPAAAAFVGPLAAASAVAGLAAAGATAVRGVRGRTSREDVTLGLVAAGLLLLVLSRVHD